MAGFRGHLCAFLLLGSPAGVRATLNCNEDYGFPWFPDFVPVAHHSSFPNRTDRCDPTDRWTSTLPNIMQWSRQLGLRECNTTYQDLIDLFTLYQLDVSTIQAPGGYSTDAPVALGCLASCRPYLDLTAYGCPTPSGLQTNAPLGISFSQTQNDFRGVEDYVVPSLAGIGHRRGHEFHGRMFAVGMGNVVYIYDLQEGQTT